MQTSGQLPVRLCILLQILFVALAAKFGLNIVMGAFTAGIVVRLAVKGAEGELLRHKLDAIGYGFLIPIFFITAGMKFEVSALWSAPLAPIQITLLLGLLVLVRGAPVFLYKNELAPDEKLPFALYSATGLPLILIISEVGVSSGVMPPDRAAILVCAGMLSVLLFPILAVRLRRKFNWP
jgi:Kef-type K+ transport system membrane component KefB